MFTPDQTGRLASPHPDLQKTVCGSCAVCKVHLNSSAEPRLLPCLHTVCNTCLTKICTDGEIQDCPLCTKSFSLSEVTECSIFEDSSDNNKDPKCGGCEESEITGWCVQCEEALCLDCMSAHRRVKVTRDHEVTPKKPPTGWIQRRRCPSHTQESLRFFCLVCEELTCKDCQLITHRGHSFVQQEEAVESQRQQLQSLLDSIKHQKETVSSSLLLLEARLQDIEDMKVVAKKMLTQVVFTIYQTLVLSATQVLKNIQALYTEEMKLLLERKASLKRLEGCQDYVAAFTDKLLSTEGYSLLVHAKRIETQVKKLLSQDTCTPETMIQLHIQVQHDICQHIVKSGFIRIKKDSIPFTSLRTGSTQSNSVSMESSNPNSVETVTDVHPIPASSSADTQVQAECVLNSPTLRPCASSQTVQMNCAFQSLPHASQLSQPFQPNQTTVHSGYNHVASSKLNQSKFPSSNHQSSCSSSPPSVQVQSHEAMSWQSKHACSPSSNCVPYFFPSAHNTHMNPPQSQINNIPVSSKLRNAGTLHYYPEMQILTLPMPGNKQKQPTPVNYQMPSPTHQVPANIQTPVPTHQIPANNQTTVLTHQIPINNQTPILTHPVSANNQTPVPTHLMPANNQTPILTYLVSANNQTPVPTHGIPANNQTPILTYLVSANNQTPVPTHGIPANNQTPVPTHGIPANNQTPVPTHPIPTNNHTPISTHPIPANNQTPISTHPIPANNQTPNSTHLIPANNHTPISTHPIPANNQTPISTQPIPANNHTSIFIQPIPFNNQTPLITHTILVSSQTPILTNPKTANVQTRILSQPLPINNQAPMLAHPKHVNNQTRVLTQPVPNMPRDTQTLILTHPVQTSFLGPVHSFDTQPNIPSAVLSTINANKNSLKDFAAASYVPSTQTSSDEMNPCASDSCTQNPTSPTFKAIQSTPCGSSLPVNPMQSPAISSNNTLWRKKDIYNSANLPVKALADSACDQEVGVSSMNFTDTDSSESNLPTSTVSDADPKEPSAGQSSTESDSGRKHWSAGMPSTFRQLVETTCTPIRSIESVSATTDKTAQSGFDHREAKEEEKQSTVIQKHFRRQFKQLKRSPFISLVRLPISLPLHGQPLPEFHITLDTSTDQILVQESQGGQINQVWRWNEDPISSGAFSCTTKQKSDINSSMASDIEFCAVCQSAGAVLLCVKCGCAFHSDCHIPPILTKPRKDWVCLLCQDVNQTAVYDSEEMMMPSLSLHDQRKCEKLLLGLLCDENRCLLYSATKRHSKTAEFDIILGRLLGKRKPPYRTAAELVSDVWTVFDILMMNSEKKNIVVELQKSFQQQLNESFGKSLHASLLKHFSIVDSRGTSETDPKKEKHRKTLKRMREFFTTNCSIVAKKPCSEKEEKERDEKSTADER